MLLSEFDKIDETSMARKSNIYEQLDIIFLEPTQHLLSFQIEKMLDKSFPLDAETKSSMLVKNDVDSN